MYEAFYELRGKPFSILPDPDMIYWGRMHSMAFTMLEFGVMNNAGFTVITGEIGSGKTTLVRHLLKKLPTNISVGLISHGQYAGSRRTMLIIDEAQNLEPEALEHLRMISNINADHHQILQLILVGQPQLRDLLQSPQLHQFAQRISSDFHLQSLDQRDVVHYIAFRLEAVGGPPPPRALFTLEACNIIAVASGGIPRMINILCDTALVYGFARGEKTISAKLVRDVIADKQQYSIFPLQSALAGR